MFAGRLQIMLAGLQLNQAKGGGYWHIVQAGNADVCRFWVVMFASCYRYSAAVSSSRAYTFGK